MEFFFYFSAKNKKFQKIQWISHFFQRKKNSLAMPAAMRASGAHVERSGAPLGAPPGARRAPLGARRAHNAEIFSATPKKFSPSLEKFSRLRREIFSRGEPLATPRAAKFFAFRKIFFAALRLRKNFSKSEKFCGHSEKKIFRAKQTLLRKFFLFVSDGCCCCSSFLVTPQ